MQTASSSTSSRALRIVLRTLSIGLALLVGLVALGLIVVGLFGDRWLNAYAQRSVAELENKLQRPIELGRLDVSALRGSVRVDKLSIGPGPNEPQDTPALTLAGAYVNVGLWRTLLSLGTRPYVEEITLRDPHINVVKLADGSLNWDHITTAEPAQPEPPASETDPRVRNAKIGRLAIQNGAVRLLEAGARPKDARISQIALELRDVGYHSGAQIALSAALLQDQRNLDVRGRLLGLREGETLPPIESLKATLAPTELAPLAPFLTALGAARAPERGVLNLNVDVRQERAEERTVAKGLIQLANAAFPGGKPFDARARFDMLLDQAAGNLELRDGLFEAGPMQLLAKASLADLDDAPKVRDLRVDSRALSFAAVRSLYPGFDELTAPARLDGPFSLEARGGGDARAQDARIELRLTEASVSVPESFAKPSGTPLVLSATIRTGENSIAFAPASLQLADFSVIAKGQIAKLDSAAPTIDMTLDTPNPEVGGLLRLLPPVARAAGKGRAFPGRLVVRGSVKGTSERYTGNAELDLAGLDVNVPGARLVGSGKAALSMRADGDKRTGKLNVDFTPLTALYTDVMQKPAGTPLRIDADFSQDKNRGQLAFASNLASLVMKGTVKLRGEAPEQSFTADLQIPTFAVRKVMRLVPGVDAASIGDIQFAGNVRAEGVTNRPERLEVHIPSFSARAGRSDLKGSLELANAEAPRIDLKARSEYLDLAEFLPPNPDAATEPEAASQPSLLGRTNGKVDVQVKRGRAADVAFENLVAQLRVTAGRARAERLEIGAFEGQFSGTGSEFPLTAERGDYHLKGAIKNAEVAGMLQRFADVDELLRGRISANVDVKARELTPDALQQTLTGILQGSLAEGAFMPANGYAALTNQLGDAARLPGLRQALDKAEERTGVEQHGEWSLRELAGVLRFERGSAVLDKPLTVKTPQGDVQLEGKIGLSTPSDLRGTFKLTPEALTALTGGEVKFGKSMPLPFRVQGPITRPVLSFGQLDQMLEPLVRSYAEQEGKEQLRKGAKEVLDQSGLDEETKRAIERNRSRKKVEEEAKRQLRKRLPF